MLFRDCKWPALRGGLLVLLWLAALWAGRNGGGGDLFVLWDSVRAAWYQHFEVVYQRDVSGPFFYPPIALIVFAFFAPVKTFFGATLVSLVFHSISYWGFWWGLQKLFPELSRKSFWVWLVPFVVAIAPLHLDFMGQNIQLPLAAFLLGIELLAESPSRGLKVLAGFLSGIVSVVKLFPLFVTATYFLRKDRALSLGILLGWLTAILLPFAVFGMDPASMLYRDFSLLLQIYHHRNLLTMNPGSLSLPSLIATYSKEWLGFAEQDLYMPLVTIIFGVLFLGVLFRQTLKGASHRSVWALSVAMMAALNSASRPDYFVFFVPAFALWATDFSILRMQERVLGILALLFIAFTQQGVVGRTWNVQLEFWRVPVFGMLALCSALALYVSVDSLTPGRNTRT